MLKLQNDKEREKKNTTRPEKKIILIVELKSNCKDSIALRVRKVKHGGIIVFERKKVKTERKTSYLRERRGQPGERSSFLKGKKSKIRMKISHFER